MDQSPESPKANKMKTNPVREKLRLGQPAFGVWLSLGNLHATRLLARYGFDWLTLDMEHSAFDWSHAAVIFAAIADAGCVPLCRVPEGNHFYIKRALDAGAWGIVAPMVDTVEQAKTIIDATKYPPVGNRSVGGGMHSLNFDAPIAEYFERANDEILVVLMIESPRGVENAEAICRLPGCDALFIGPTDLSFNMRTPDGRRPTDGEIEVMIQRVAATGRRMGTPIGIHVMEPRDALRRTEQGMQFLAIGSDLHMLNAAAVDFIKILYPEKDHQGLARY
jgi:4-hydroxy-2-oxoheptanedioate aldolase